MRIIHVRELPSICDSVFTPSLGDISYPNAEKLAYRKAVLVTNYEQYTEVGFIKGVDIIFIGEGSEEMSRLSLIYRLIQNGELFSNKKNWLFGVSNPAELGLYLRMFSGYVNRHIQGAICESTYQYAVYGAMFSRIKGVLSKIPGSVPLPDKLDREQSRVFYYNSGVVSEFLNGNVSDDYLGRASVMIDEGAPFYG